jgi:hypothetical protein
MDTYDAKPGINLHQIIVTIAGVHGDGKIKVPYTLCKYPFHHLDWAEVLNR